MSKSFKRSVTLLIILGLAWIAYLPVYFRPPEPPPKVHKTPPPGETAPEALALSMLAEKPDWSALEIFQNTISRTEFERLLGDIFTTGSAWRNFIEISDSAALVKTGGSEPAFELRFSTPGAEISARRHWRTAAEMPPAPPERPLDGLKIALDPGHIGGGWAKMEERWFVVGSGSPVCEGDMTLRVANLLKPKLEALGATVSLVRDKTEPVTSLRPDDLAKLTTTPGTTTDPLIARKDAERLFYRTAEIRARADRVNLVLQPDIVICLHFNAEAWGDPNSPTLIDHTHLHLLLNGAYTDDEVALADQRFALLHKLLQRTHDQEMLVGASIADSFAATAKLPAYSYLPFSPNVRAVPENPYLWIRNLLANRLYNCPVIYMEPYTMNSTIDYPRIQAGDFEGLHEIGGKMLPSIFREYADSVATGLASYYRAHRLH